MHSANFFDWLGHVFGELIRTIVHALQYLMGGLGAAVGDFFAGLARAIGVSPSTFNVAWLILGLCLLYLAIRALLRRSLVATVIWLLLAVVVLGRLVH